MGWVSPFRGWVSSSSVLQGVLARQGHDVIAFMQSSMWVQVVLKLAQRTERGTVLDYLLSLRQSFRFLGYIPSSRIVGLYSSFFFLIFENRHIAFTVTMPIYTPTNSAQVAPSLHAHASPCLLVAAVLTGGGAVSLKFRFSFPW